MRRLTPEQQVLASQNVALVGFTIQRMGLNPDDDLISAGYLGLVQAAGAFKRERGYRFSGYAVRCIHNEISRHLKKQRTHQWSADSPPDTPDPRDPAFQVADAEQASMIWSAVNRLPRRQRRLIRLAFQEGLGVAGAGRRLRLNGSLKRVHAEALARLADFLKYPT